jgi:TPR repeat protein
MKKFIGILTLFVFIVSIAHAQDMLKAKMEFEEAEAAYAANKYQLAIEKLTKAEELIGKWVPNISYLKIQALDKVCNYEELKDPNRIPLAKEIKSYLAFANANQNAIVFDKFKEVVQIEKRWNYARENEEWIKMEEYVAGKKAANKKESMDYLSKAAARNNPAAMFEIGMMYYFGEGVAENYPTAMGWFKKAAEKNHIDALEYIGSMYSLGLGVDENYTEAVVWYQKAIEYGSTRAFNGMGYIYQFGGNGIAENPLEAISWYNKGADKGYASSMYNIAEMYEKGTRVPQNYSEAFTWYSKAAEKEYYQAMKKVSNFYEKGLGVTKNIDLAVEWLKKAIEVNKR